MVTFFVLGNAMVHLTKQMQTYLVRGVLVYKVRYSCKLLRSTGDLFAFTFCTEDGSDMLLRNARNHPKGSTAP
jgi:hypothetical protein